VKVKIGTISAQFPTNYTFSRKHDDLSRTDGLRAGYTNIT